MDESRTKLAQEKLKGLIRMLISEALPLNKTWEEIKDSLCPKICNSDIHTSISHFIEIQERKKNLWQHIYIALKGKLADANSIKMLQLSEFS